ncbi:MAG: isoprenyl transferase [Chlorobi bacterium]|nr:isoprenyl transferase [Chlorobiota bacterium]
MQKRKKQSSEDKAEQQHLLEQGNIPRHIAIIMDGNGRWAKAHGLNRINGHRQGVNSVREIVEVCGQLGVSYLTLYTFSTENWRRPADEVSMLMRLLLKALRDETDALHENNVRLLTIGDTDSLPEKVRIELCESVEKTASNTGLTLILALSYSGRWDLTQAMRKIAREVQEGDLTWNEVTESVIEDHLSTAGIPDPDLLIRTSGEMRISNFLLWQLAYTEFFVVSNYWPEFRRKALYDAIRAFQRRERRFGMVSEQLQTSSPSKSSLLRSAIDAFTSL